MKGALFFAGLCLAGVIGSHTICHDDLCYPSIFVPTSEFMVVHDDQDIPAGLHVRINVATGLKEAKIYTGEEDVAEHEAVALVPGEEVHDAKPVKSVKPYPPTTPLKGSDLFQFEAALKTLESQNHCSTLALEALDSLEDLVHELEFGLRVIDQSRSMGLDILLHYIQSKTPECRAKAALVLGSALRNNDNALHALPDTFSLTSQLLNAIDIEKNTEAQRMMIYALSAIMSHGSAAKDYKLSAGHQIMLHTYTAGTDEVQAKIASFVEDHFAQEPSTKTNIRIQTDETYGSNLIEQEALGDWCLLFQQSLIKPSLPEVLRGKLLSSISQIKRNNMDVCSATQSFLAYLADESMGKLSGSSESKAMARSARSLFGNYKASRKHGVADL